MLIANALTFYGLQLVIKAWHYVHASCKIIYVIGLRAEQACLWKERKSSVMRNSLRWAVSENWSWESNQTKSIMQGSHSKILSILGPLNDISPSTSTLSCLHMPRLLSYASWFFFFLLLYVLLLCWLLSNILYFKHFSFFNLSFEQVCVVKC